MLDHVNDYYIKDLNKIKKNLGDMWDYIMKMGMNITKKTPAASKDNKLKELILGTVNKIHELEEHLENNYEGIEHY